jgi:hypothetical protein
VPDPPIVDALYDYVYLDRIRIAAYAAQLDDNGVLSQLKRQTSAGDETKIEGKVDLQVAGVKQGDSAKSSSAIEHLYDASWSVPLDVLALLDKNGLVNDGLDGTKVGQLVIIRGDLELVDIRLLRDLWAPIFELWSHNESEAVKALQKQVNSIVSAPNTRVQKKQLTAAAAEARATVDSTSVQMGRVLKILEKLPHALHASLRDPVSGEKIWMSLDPTNLTTNVDDFALKHGASIPGDWSVVGILDAFPDPDRSTPEVSGAAIHDIMRFVTDFMQNLLGRPAAAYGLTPIAIYRTVVASHVEPDCI